jgi:hypothetical protein
VEAEFRRLRRRIFIHLVCKLHCHLNDTFLQLSNDLAPLSSILYDVAYFRHLFDTIEEFDMQSNDSNVKSGPYELPCCDILLLLTDAAYCNLYKGFLNIWVDRGQDQLNQVAGVRSWCAKIEDSKMAIQVTEEMTEA